MACLDVPWVHSKLDSKQIDDEAWRPLFPGMMGYKQLLRTPQSQRASKNDLPLRMLTALPLRGTPNYPVVGPTTHQVQTIKRLP